MRAGLALSAVVVGCYSPHPTSGAPCATDRDCPPPQQCIIDRCGGSPLDHDAPSSSLTFTASNGVDLGWADPLAATIKITAPTTFDTDSGEIIGDFKRPPGSGTRAEVDFRLLPDQPVAAFVFHELIIEPAGAVRFTGVNAVALVVGTNLVVDGLVDGSAGCAIASQFGCAGPGGTAGGKIGGVVAPCGGQHGDQGFTSASGGGGGGFGATGGDGGRGGSLTGGLGGPVCGTDTSEPLVGGGGGGGGAQGFAGGAVGGGGGGGVQLTARAVRIGGVIAVNGGGGRGGESLLNSPGGGAGGGAGGALVVEALDVTFTAARLAANGGGGGGGATGSTASGEPGENGSVDLLPAKGGTAAGAAAGGGGNGGYQFSAAQPGGAGGATSSSGGGGGGAVGRIRVRAITPTLDGLTSSPTPMTDVIVPR